MAEQGYTFDLASAQLIARVVRQVLAEDKRTAPQRRTHHTIAPVSFLAKTGASGITARSGTTPGSGTVTIYNLIDGVLTANETTKTAYNLSASEVAAVTYVICHPVGGKLFVIVEDCS